MIMTRITRNNFRNNSNNRGVTVTSGTRIPRARSLPLRIILTANRNGVGLLFRRQTGLLYVCTLKRGNNSNKTDTVITTMRKRIRNFRNHANNTLLTVITNGSNLWPFLLRRLRNHLRNGRRISQQHRKNNIFNNIFTVKTGIRMRLKRNDNFMNLPYLNTGTSRNRAKQSRMTLLKTKNRRV